MATESQKRKPEDILALHPQTTEAQKQAVPTIDVSRLKAAQTAVKTAVSQQETKAEIVLTRAFNTLGPVIPNGSQLRTLLG